MEKSGNRSFYKPRDRRLLLKDTVNESMLIPGEISSEETKLNASMIDKSEFRIRSTIPKVNIINKPKPKDIFENFDDFVREIIEKEIDISSETELYLRLLGNYLDMDVEDIKHAKKVEFLADTTNLTLQSFGEALPELIELKLNDSVIVSIKDIGTSFKSLKVLWISRVGLKELAGIAMFPCLEELYASYNFISDISDIEFLENLRVLDLEANNVTDIMQLTYIPGHLRTITLTDNKVTEHPDYIQTLLKYGSFLKNVDNVEVKKDLTGIYSMTTLSTPASKHRKSNNELCNDKIIERFKALGLDDQIIMESIKKADTCLENEPLEEEILRQSIKCSNKREYISNTEPQLKYIPGIKKIPTAGQKRRIDRLQRIAPLEQHSEIDDSVDGYSELVSNTETTFAGNPVKVARRKRTISKEKTGASNIYELIDTFKDNSESFKEKINSKLKLYQGLVAVRNQSLKSSGGVKQTQVIPEIRKPVTKSRRGLSAIRMRNFKK